MNGLNGMGKKAADEWKRTMESQGFKVYKKYTTDNEYGYRDVRKKDPKFVEAIRVWAAGRGWKGLWYIAKRP